MKPFAWSWSALTLFETCPKKYYEQRIAKSVKDTKGEKALYGDDVHKALDKRISKKTPLPVELRHLEKYAVSVETAPGTKLAEQKLAINRDLKPTGWFDDDVWCRAIVDAAIVNPPTAVLLDWKTGKKTDDPGQLAVSSAVFMATFPEVSTVRSGYVWLQSKSTSDETYERGDLPAIWADLLERVHPMEESIKNHNFPAKPNGLCRNYCPVVACPHNGANER